MDMTTIQNLTEAQLLDIRQTYARNNHLQFMRYCWQRQNEQFLVGQHTRAICTKLDNAMVNFKKGISSFLLIEVCFRHGKSEIVSRYFPPHFLAENPDCEVILTSHKSELANEFSRDAQRIIESDRFVELYPNVKLEPGHSAVSTWGIDKRLGKAQYFGIQSGTAGKGGHLLIVDDFFGNREQAESAQIRNKVNEAFGNDIISRRAPVAIIIVCVTPWHVNDITGLIREKMKKDRHFPRFEILKFPAFSSNYSTGTLFPERFNHEWYESSKAVLTNDQGLYGYYSLMQCEPRSKEGNLIKVANIKTITKEEFELLKPTMQCVRAWDVASSEAQIKKSDPDYTTGAKVWMLKEESQIAGVSINKVYIEDVISGRWEALKREQIMLSTALSDGRNCPVVVESYGGYKDAFTRMSTLLSGVCQVNPYHKKEDKLVKATLLEIASESHNLTIVEAEWNESLIQQFGEFPSGAHDDKVDACAIGVNFLANRPSILIYTIDDLLNEVQQDTSAFNTALQQLQNNRTVGCTAEFYSKMRKYLTDLQEEKVSDNVKRNALNEIARLDKLFNYKDIYNGVSH